MHYCSDGSPIQPAYKHPGIETKIDEVAERVPETSWRETEDPLPLRHSTHARAIALACYPFCTGAPRTDAVYVLECLDNPAYQHTAAWEVGRVSKPWNGDVEEAARLLYVGMTINLFRRLNEHLNSPGDDGADFTTVFRPVRVLDVSWWPSPQVAQEAEQLLADQLEERFPGDYVYQS